MEVENFNGSNSTNDTDCLKILVDELDTWKVTTISVCSSSSVVCILAVIFILASKGYKQFVHRLTLYLIVVDLLKTIVMYYLCTAVELLWL